MPRTNVRSRTNGNQTKERILDAAETLFANQGFEAVSLRDITVQAEVTLALASYHFGTKERLFESVVERRATFLCDLRRQRLTNLSEQELGDVSKILDAFMKPLFDQVQGREKHWSDYVKLLSRLGVDDRWLDLLSRCFDTVAIEFDLALRKALPQVAPHDVTRAFIMTLQLMLVTVARHRRLDALTDGALRADDLTAAYEFLLRYATAGVLNLNPR